MDQHDSYTQSVCVRVCVCVKEMHAVQCNSFTQQHSLIQSLQSACEAIVCVCVCLAERAQLNLIDALTHTGSFLTFKPPPIPVPPLPFLQMVRPCSIPIRAQ